MTITLPDEMKDDLKRKAEDGGFATIEQYVIHTLQLQFDGKEEDLDGMTVPEALTIKSREDLNAKLLEGLNSGPAVRMTPELWEKLKRRAEAHSTHQNPKS